MLLSTLEGNKGNIDRAVKHLVIAAKQGIQEAVTVLKNLYVKRDGTVVNKEVFAEALRGYQVVADAMKSPQREAAKQKFLNSFELDD